MKKSIICILTITLFLLFTNNVAANVNSELIEASKEGQLRKAEAMINQGADVNYKNMGMTPLIHASKSGSYEIAKLLIENGADVNSIDKAGYYYTPLIHSLINNNPEIAELLIDYGADVNSYNPDSSNPEEGFYALHYAVIFDFPKVVNSLIENGANITQKTIDGTNSLMEAAKENSIKSAKVLIDKTNIDINAINDENGKNALIYASEMNPFEEDNYRIVKFLIDSGANINSADFNGKTALMYTSIYANYETTRLLLENKADINQRDYSDNTALIFSVKGPIKEGSGNIMSIFGGNIEREKVIRTLIKNGADINAANSDGKTIFDINLDAVGDHYDNLLNMLGILQNKSEYPLLYSVIRNDMEKVDALISEGYDVNNYYPTNNRFVDDWNWKPLVSAVLGNNLKMVEKLIANGANIDVEIYYDNDGEPILFTSLRYDYIDISLAMLKHLVKNPLSPSNDYPYEYQNILLKSVRYDQLKVVEYLLDNGADVNKSFTSSEENLLMNAQSYEMAKLLIEKGIKINHLDSRGLNALYYFLSDNDIDIVKLLLENGINYEAQDVLNIAKRSNNTEKFKELIKSY